VERFEQEFAGYCGTAHCIGIASGLDALILSLKAYEFPAGSEVIVPSNTYVATILAILHAGLTPVLVEDIRGLRPGLLRKPAWQEGRALRRLRRFQLLPHQEPGRAWRWWGRNDR
jgi:hypothetical protein